METKIAKLTAAIEVDTALDRMVQASNDGFSGGRVTKHDLVTWAIMYFEKHRFQECIEKIRQDHFDQVAYLDSVLKEAKKARRAGATPEQVAALLAPLSAASGKVTGGKRPRRQEQTEMPLS